MKKRTKKIIVATTIGVIAIGGVGAIVLAPNDTIPPIEYVLDEPIADPGNVRAQLQLLTGGGTYQDRKIDVIVTKRTAKENRDVLLEFNTEIKQDKDKLDPIDEDKRFDKVTK